MRSERGSALLIALFVISIGALIALAVLDYSSSAYRRAQKDADRQTLRNIAEAGIARVQYEVANAQNMAQSVTSSYGGGSFTVTSSSVASPVGGVQVTCTATYKNQTYSVTRLMGCGYHISHPFDYAITANGNWTLESKAITTGSAGTNGDMFVQGNATFKAASFVNGNLYTTGTMGTQPLVTGNIENGVSTITIPSVDFAHYASIAGSYYSSGGTWAGVTFTAPYQVVYINGNTTLGGGTISGTGIVVINGNLDLNNGNLTYQAGAKAVFMCKNVHVHSATSQASGWYYCPAGSFTCDSTTRITGGVVANTFALSGSLTVILDPSLRDDPDLAYNLQLPGY